MAKSENSIHFQVIFFQEYFNYYRLSCTINENLSLHSDDLSETDFENKHQLKMLTAQ